MSVHSHKILNNYPQHADNSIACGINDINVIIFYDVLSAGT